MPHQLTTSSLVALFTFPKSAVIPFWAGDKPCEFEDGASHPNVKESASSVFTPISAVFGCECDRDVGRHFELLFPMMENGVTM